MQNKELPEPDFYTLSTFAQKQNCSEDYILNLVLTGQIQANVISRGWYIETGIMEPFKENDPKEDWHSLLENIYFSSGDFLNVFPSCVNEVISAGQSLNPSFVTEPGRYLGISLQNQKNVSIRRSDLVFTHDAVGIGSSEELKTKNISLDNLSAMKRENRENLTINYAVEIWLLYQETHKSPPRMKYIKDEIRKKFDLDDDTKPSLSTVMKPITQKKILKEIRSRKKS